MVKSVIVKLAKKYIVRSLNDVLEKKSKDVDEAKKQIALWSSRAQQILEILDAAMKYLEDNKLDDAEVDEIVAKAEAALEAKI